MHITIWSDFVCPFCYIGETHLQLALKNFQHKDEVTLEYKSYLLMPDAAYVEGDSYAETFSRLKGMELKQVEAMLQQVTNMATKAGLSFDFSIAKMVNTNRAHRLFQYAKTKHLSNEFFNRLYRSHFTEGMNIDAEIDLMQLGREVGLEQDTVQEIFHSDQFFRRSQTRYCSFTISWGSRRILLCYQRQVCLFWCSTC